MVVLTSFHRRRHECHEVTRKIVSVILCQFVDRLFFHHETILGQIRGPLARDSLPLAYDDRQRASMDCETG